MLSVIVPVYNTERYLNKCIESIVKQTYKDLEIILVDDGSTDSSAAICDQWARKDDRIVVIHKNNEGPSSARNSGIDIAKGEFLYFVDSDDYISLDLCKQILAYFDYDDIDIAVFNALCVDEKGKELGYTENIEEENLTAAEALMCLVTGNINNYAWNKMYRKHVFDGIRYPVGRAWEDIAVTYQLFRNSRKIRCTSKTYYYYVQRSGSIAHTLNAKAIQDIFWARHKLYCDLKEGYPQIADEALRITILSARRLYDRSLWEKVDEDILGLCKSFLSEKRDEILAKDASLVYILFYRFPWLYKRIRIMKHFIGNIVRCIKQRKMDE